MKECSPILIFFHVCLFVNASKAQQLPLMTYYREHHAMINPATMYYESYTAGNNPSFSAGVSFRQQWLKVKDAPRTMTARFEQNLDEKNMLYGFSLMNDALGLSDLTGGNLRYAYQFSYDEHKNNVLSIGLNVGFLHYRYKPSRGALRDQNDVTAITPLQQGVFDFSAGVFWRSILSESNVLYGGISVPQLFAKSIAYDNSTPISRYQHYYALIGFYHFFKDVDGIKSFIEPSLWLRYIPKIPMQVDANVRVNFGHLWVGGGVSSSFTPKISLDIMHAEAGVRIFIKDHNPLKIGYGFDITTNKAAVKLGSTHEINLVYSW